MLGSLSRLWRRRLDVVRRIERAASVPSALADEFADLNAVIAKAPAETDDDREVKLALLRELAEEAPDRELMLDLIDSLAEGLRAGRVVDEALPFCVRGGRAKKTQGRYFPLEK
ncbi:hypothetical protein [Azospirillum thermophilum]|uniref:Uncharacterized protein n=1 Tax=Azospirillum thermophilum TaxID=2202148 RepID=A0A2S2D1L1_9PROT|nr:hypothetical protein [Azospirillum thermophilum]AWK90327.1 hypothetical protein DEW08_30390 [Azospirillum thermophilum]